MSATSRSGFTIIETLLFLAITGLLILGVLAGTGTAINVQRYRDSVGTFKSYLQEQYSEAINVRNEERATGLSCDSDANTSVSGATEQRGQTDCIVLGRYISITGGTITASTVVGYNAAPSSSYSDDITELQGYNMSRLSLATETTEIEWGMQIAWPRSGSGSQTPTTPRTLSLLIVRSPSSGLVYTFSANNDPSDISTLVVSGAAGFPSQAGRRICIVSNDPLDRLSIGLAVSIAAYAAGQSAIEIRSDEMGDSSSCG